MKTILTVDDNPVNLASIRMILKDSYDVRIARTGQTACDILGNTFVDLMLLDIEMPDINGFDLLARIRKIPGRLKTPAVFVTSLANKSFILQAFEMGAADYIVKPINKEVMLGKIRRIFGNQEAEELELETAGEAEAGDAPAWREDPADFLYQRLSLLKHACSSGKADLAARIIIELGKGGLPAETQKHVRAMADSLKTFDYTNIIKLINWSINSMGS